MDDNLDTLDPIVEEIHQIRQQLVREHGGMEGLCRALKKWEEIYPERIVRDRQVPLPDLSRFLREEEAAALTPPSPSA